MKKVIGSVALFVTIVLVSCGSGPAKNSTTDSTKIDSVKIDTNAVKVDTAKK